MRLKFSGPLPISSMKEKTAMANLNVPGVTSGATPVDFLNPQSRQQNPSTPPAAVEDKVTLSHAAKSGVHLHIPTTGQTSQKNGNQAHAAYLSSSMQDRDHDGDNR
jgi:hypothetical protein